jgi:exodeoxyribonuclease-5
MVDGPLAHDLLATGCRVVATGDPGQLPPVRGTRFFDRADFTLREVRRQALDSAVLRQAHAVRGTGAYRADGEDFRVQRSVGRDDILAANVILCWRNATRHALNALVRAHRGLDGPPLAGEPVMCLRNDHKLGVLNGAQYELLRDYDTRRRALSVRNERGMVVDIEDVRFETVDPPGDPEEAQDEHPFAYGYVITTHKSQGSSWEKLIFVDEYDRQEWRREFVYTAITRAEKKVLVHNSWM